jgi:signal transduction histidine kinase
MADFPTTGGADTKFLTSPGELGAMILAHDWSATPLGPIDRWPSSLKTAVSLMLSSRQPMWIGWGKDATFLYNDAYIDVLSLAKHPWALGRPAAEVWSEIWDICGPLADVVFVDGDATMADDVRLFMNRGDILEETYYSFSYSPIRDESGNVAGLFCPNLNVTATHLNARRLRALSELATRALTEKSVEAACASAMATLAANPADVPFAQIYLCADDARPELVQASASALADPALPLCLAAGGVAAPFPVAAVLDSLTAREVDLAPHPALPEGLAGQRLKQALVLPLAGGPDQALGVLVLGVSAALRLDGDYRRYFELLATQVATAIQNARASEDERTRLALLAEVDRAKTLFFSNVSHEFRTPLTLMLGPLDEVLAEDRLEGGQRERLQLVQRNARRLQKLVNTLLEFSRVQAGRAQADFLPLDLSALTAELAGSFRSTIEAGGVALVVDCPPLPSPVYIDPAMWEKIILNLLSNAFKFTFAGAITVTVRQDHQQAVVTVSDTGGGIAAAEMPRLFERFHRIAGGPARTHEGSGIGLALVHDLVALHGGVIEASSTPGVGTSFRIAIPLGSAHLDPAHVRQHADADADAAAALHSQSVPSYVAEAEGWIGGAGSSDAPPLDADPPVGTDPARILVADDNADMRDYLRRLFGRRWQVEVVGDGLAALEAVRREAPDLVVSDVMMPRLDGFGLLAALRQEDATRHVPLVLLSARAGEEARVEGLAAGADDYIVKPFSGRELVARVDALLLRRRVRAVETAAAKRLQAIFAQAPVAIAITRGPQHVFEQANAYYVALVGGRDVVGKAVRAALPELEGQGFIDLLDQVYASGTPYVGRSMRVMLDRGDGQGPSEAFFDFVYQPLLDGEGQVEGLATVSFEVTELAGAKRAAEAANRAKDEFLAMLGHELRNPLAPIVTALQLMRLRGVDAAHKERDIIERQTRHLVALVDDLLDVARVAQGKIVLHKARVEIADVIARAIETASPLIEQKRHLLAVDVPARGLAVLADPARLAQAVANVLANAAKYTEEGGRLRIAACHEPQTDGEGGSVVITVDDNGIGIDAVTLPLIFDMFVQERQALSRSQGGLGLGLAIVKSMLELHGGQVSAASAGAGMGSRFSLRLPALGEHAAALAAPPHGTPALAHTPVSPSGLAVLVVDDNEDAARVLGEMLALQGHRVELAFDGPGALAVARRTPIDVGLLDIGLPGMDGYELAQALRADRAPGQPPLRLFAITGYGQDADRQRAAAAGFDRHLVKPVDFGALAAALALPEIKGH